MKKSIIIFLILLCLSMPACIKKKRNIQPLQQTTQLRVMGVECEDCVKLVEKKVGALRGVISARYVPDNAQDYEPGLLTIVHTHDWNGSNLQTQFQKLGFEIIQD